MHPAISHDLAQAHVADLRHRAQRDTVVRAARLARRNQPGPALSRLGAGGGQAQATASRLSQQSAQPRFAPTRFSATNRGRSCLQP
jgi:hypothetical protein